MHSSRILSILKQTFRSIRYVFKDKSTLPGTNQLRSSLDTRESC